MQVAGDSPHFECIPGNLLSSPPHPRFTPHLPDADYARLVGVAQVSESIVESTGGSEGTVERGGLRIRYL